MEKTMVEIKGWESEIPQAMFTVKKLASILNIHPSTVRRWEREGLLRAYRIGPRRNLRFKQEDLFDFLDKSNKNNAHAAKK